MAVEGALSRARSMRVESGIRLDGAIGLLGKPLEDLEDGLVKRLAEECKLDADDLETIYNSISDMFEERVLTKALQANPTFYTPQLVRETSNCPSGLSSDVLGLLDVGLMHHNNSETKLAASTYIEAMKAWVTNIQKSHIQHTEAQAQMFCLCAIGQVLESDTSQAQGHLDPIALAVYMLACLIGKNKTQIEVALSHSCMGAVLFHIGLFARALESFTKAERIRHELALADELAGKSVTAQEMAVLYNNMAACHAALDENVEADELYRQAIHIFRHECGPDHMYTNCVHRNLDRVQKNIALHPPVYKLRPTDPVKRQPKEKKGKKGKKKKK